MKITQEIIKELIDYNPETGLCFWKERDIKWFEYGFRFNSNKNCEIWNKKYSSSEIKSIGNDGYIRTSVLGKYHLLHRLIWLYMTGEWPDQVDHIDGDRVNNKWSNLRNVNNLENSKNRGIQSNNTSGVVGVVWHKHSNKWLAQIKLFGKNIHLGVFDLKEEAIQARKEAEIKYGYHPNHGRK